MGKTVTTCCPHLFGGYAEWVVNDGIVAPVLLLDAFSKGPFCLTLTNGTIYFNCPACFEANRRAAVSKYSPEPTSRLLT